jgi:hypothetical protein
MPLNPLCLVQDGAGPFLPTTNGVDVTPSNTISIKLLDASVVVDWYLQVIGTDELSTTPVLTGVNGLTHQVTSPTTIVTFTFPAGVGHAVGFKSTVTGVGGPLEVTFGTYSLTTFATRVGFVTETREGDTSFGWSTKLNPLIRAGSGGGGADNFSWKTIPSGATVVLPQNQQMIVIGGLELDGTLDLIGELILPEI